MGQTWRKLTYDQYAKVKEYNKYCKKLKFIEGNEITVKVNQKFASRSSANFTVPPEYWESFAKNEIMSKEIQLVETKTFYPYPSGHCGGSDVQINVYKATKKGKFTLKIDDENINVIVI